MNQVILIGNLGGEPEFRHTQSGTVVVKFSLATSFKPKNGEEKTEWHNVTFFGRMAEVIEQYVHKGDKLCVQGRIEYSQSEKDGVTRYWTNIIGERMEMLGGGSRSVNGESRQAGQGAAAPPAGAPAGAPSAPDDDLPF